MFRHSAVYGFTWNTSYPLAVRTGRRVVYTVNRGSLFRHHAQDGHRVGPFLDLLAADGTEEAGRDDADANGERRA